MTPATTRQNLLLWAGALAVSVLLAFLTGIATHWPEGGTIDWRGVCLDVIQVLLSVIPIVAAGLGLPRIGKEPIAALVSEVGTNQAKAALEVEAIKQQMDMSAPPDVSQESPARRRPRPALEDEAS